jgi:hypothetical protein
MISVTGVLVRVGDGVSAPFEHFSTQAPEPPGVFSGHRAVQQVRAQSCASCPVYWLQVVVQSEYFTSGFTTSPETVGTGDPPKSPTPAFDTISPIHPLERTIRTRRIVPESAAENFTVSQCQWEAGLIEYFGVPGPGLLPGGSDRALFNPAFPF